MRAPTHVLCCLFLHPTKRYYASHGGRSTRQEVEGISAHVASRHRQSYEKNLCPRPLGGEGGERSEPGEGVLPKFSEQGMAAFACYFPPTVSFSRRVYAG